MLCNICFHVIIVYYRFYTLFLPSILYVKRKATFLLHNLN